MFAGIDFVARNLALKVASITIKMMSARVVRRRGRGRGVEREASCEEKKESHQRMSRSGWFYAASVLPRRSTENKFSRLTGRSRAIVIDRVIARASGGRFTACPQRSYNAPPSPSQRQAKGIPTRKRKTIHRATNVMQQGTTKWVYDGPSATLINRVTLHLV